MIRHKRYIYILALLLVSTSACRTHKVTSITKELKSKSPSYVLKRYEKEKFDFKWAGMKISAELLTPEKETESFTANIRMQKDSVIWISLSPLLGVEVFRVLATRDSVKVLSKIPKNKYYALGSSEMLSDLIGIELHFTSLQDLFIGNGFDLDLDDQKYRSKVDDHCYVLLSKYNRKIRRVVGEDDKGVMPNDTLSVTNEKKYNRVISHSEEEDLLVRRYWINGENFKLEKMVINDIYNKRTIQIDYEDFKKLDSQIYPSKGRLTVEEPDRLIILDFKIGRIKLTKSYDFPFAIPDNIDERKF